VFELVGTARNGATGAPRTEVIDNVAIGEDIEHTLSAGRRGAPDLCDLVAPAESDPAQFLYLWRVRAHVRSVSLTQSTLDVDWHRSGPENYRTPSDGEVQAITLGPGEYRLLDYVRDRTGTSPCANVQLQVRADPVPQSGAQPTLTYDLWLVHDNRGERRVVHRSVEGRSGHLVTVDLEPFTWSSGGLTDLEQASQPVLMKVRSSLVATLRADGSLGMSVRAMRTVSCGGSEVSGQGQEDFQGALGETVSLLLPPPRGRAMVAAGGQPSSPGRGAVARGAVFDFASFFAGTQTSLYVRVSRRD
jgi:hypothetical protein